MSIKLFDLKKCFMSELKTYKKAITAANVLKS